MKFKENLQIEKDYHLGCEVKSDLSTVTEAYATLAMAGDNGNYFLRGNITEKLLSAGTWFKTDDYGAHNVELWYDITGTKKGINDMPLFLKWAGKKPIGAIDYKYAMLIGQTPQYKD